MQPVTLVMNSQWVSSAYPAMMYPPMKNAIAVQAVPQMQNIPIGGGDHLDSAPLEVQNVGAKCLDFVVNP
jgi:hypothetical protein